MPGCLTPACKTRDAGLSCRTVVHCRCATLDRRRAKRGAGVKDQTGVFYNTMTRVQSARPPFDKAYAGLRLETGVRCRKRRLRAETGVTPLL